MNKELGHNRVGLPSLHSGHPMGCVAYAKIHHQNKIFVKSQSVQRLNMILRQKIFFSVCVLVSLALTD